MGSGTLNVSVSEHCASPPAGYPNEPLRGHRFSITVTLGMYIDPEIYIVLEGWDQEHIYRLTARKDRTEVIDDVATGVYNLYIDVPAIVPYSLLGILIQQDVHLYCSMGFSFLPPDDVKVIVPEMDISWSPPIYEYQPKFFEGFESGAISHFWRQEFITDSLSWSAQTGLPSGSPGYAIKGEFNAGLPGDSGITVLALPALDLSQSVKPVLDFWFAQVSDSNAVHDRLGIFYKPSTKDGWKPLTTFCYGTGSWSGALIHLPEPSRQYSIGFRGDLSSPGGLGICLDEIAVLSGHYDPESDPVEGYEVYLDGHFYDRYDQTGRYPLRDLPPGFHIAGVQAIYEGGESLIAEVGFYSTPCTYLNQPANFYGLVEGNDIILHWEAPPGLSGAPEGKQVLVRKLNDPDTVMRFELTGYRIWYFDRLLAYVPDIVYEFTDTPVSECDSTQIIRHRYTITAVYDQGESCKLDPPYEAYSNWGYDMPGTVTASKTGGDSVMVCWLPAPGGKSTGYNLYRNRQLVSAVTDTFYLEPIVNMGTWNYEVTALNQDGKESCFAGPAVFSCRTNGLKGRVDDVATQNPLAGAMILLIPGNHSVLSEKNGTYCLEDIPPGTYQGSVSLTGYHGRDFQVIIGESGFATRNILLADSSLSLLPFREPWDSCSFTFQHWSFDTVQGLWNVSESEGNPVPCASFGGEPPMTGYECRLVSNRMDVSGRNGNLYLDLDLKLDPVNPTGSEILDIEIWNGREWALCGSFHNLEGKGWEDWHYDATDVVHGNITQVRLTARGTNSADIGTWYVDNISLETGVKGILSGYVTGPSGAPLEGIVVATGEAEAITDQEGFYTLEVLAGHQTVSVTTEQYNPWCDTVYVYGTVDLMINLTQPALDAHPPSLYVESWGGTETRELDLVNQGSGPAEWKASIHNPGEGAAVKELKTGIRYSRLPGLPSKDIGSVYLNAGEAQTRETWDLLFAHDLSTAADGIDNQTGVIFTGEVYYVSLWNASRILSYSVQGEFLGSFELTGAENLRNLAWDGDFLYGGAATHVIYQIDPQTFTVVQIISSPVFVRGIAYDPQNDAFWVCDWETGLYLVGRQGQTLSYIPNPGTAGVYGIAYDGLTGPASLWLFCQGDPGATFVRLDIATGQLTGQIHDVLAEVNASGYPLAGGAFLTADAVPGVVTLGGILQAENTILFGYELKPSSWLSLSSYRGQLESGESQQLEVRFDGEGLTWGETYEAEIRFTCDPAVAVPDVPVAYTLLTWNAGPAISPEVTIFPNPAAEQMVIECREPMLRIDLYDHLGRQVACFDAPQEKTIRMNTAGLPFGLYYVEVWLPGERKVVKKTIIF